MENDKRSFKGYIFNCLSCNRPLDSYESIRTYHKSDELIGLCTTCISKSKVKPTVYDVMESTQDNSEGTTSPTYNNLNGSYYYEWYD
jgi:hypothetical protein